MLLSGVMKKQSSTFSLIMMLLVFNLLIMFSSVNFITNCRIVLETEENYQQIKF